MPAEHVVPEFTMNVLTRMTQNKGTRCFFYHLLVSPLNAALPLTHVNRVAGPIPEYLYLNMPRGWIVLFDEHSVVLEQGLQQISDYKP